MATLNPIPNEVFDVWHGAGDFFQAKWDAFLDVVGEDHAKLWIYGSAILSTITYWIFGGLLIYMDFALKPRTLRKYKIQVGTNEPLDWPKLKKALKVILFNQIVINGVMLYLFYTSMKMVGLTPLRQLPTLSSIIIDIVIFILLEEIMFYYSHRALHYKFLYKWIHKTHHEWTSPVAVTAIYCNPIEHIFSNLLPIQLNVFIMRSHIVTAWIWTFLATVNTLSDHSGYHLPFLRSSEFHDFHHAKYNNNFGVLGVLDWLHGTDTAFRKTLAFKRNKLLLGLKSAREKFPNEAKKNTK